MAAETAALVSSGARSSAAVSPGELVTVPANDPRMSHGSVPRKRTIQKSVNPAAAAVITTPTTANFGPNFRTTPPMSSAASSPMAAMNSTSERTK